MCHHYRKIFNAKPCVDTSPPEIFKLRTNKWMQDRTTALPLKIMTNLKRIQSSAQNISSKLNNESTICPYYHQHHMKDAKSMSDLNESFVMPKKPFTPTILKTNAQSKLRYLHVYHPPRKKEISSKSVSRSSLVKRENKLEKNSSSTRVLDKSKIKGDKMPIRATNHSEESSEDSAYNEGEGAMSSDSRGSTPQKSTQRSFSKKMIPVGSKNNARHEKTNTSSGSTKEDILCIQFLKEITSDILKKNIFTNKSLRNVLNYHIQINKYNLQPELIQAEVAKLQDRLGIPKDDKFDDEDYGLGKDIFDDDDGIETIEDNDASNFTKNITTNESINLKVNSKPDENQSAKSIESEDFENYSESFSNVSQSSEDRKNKEKIDLTESVDVVTSDSNDREESDQDDLPEENVPRDLDSDSGENFEKVDSESEVESDLEISEISLTN